MIYASQPRVNGLQDAGPDSGAYTTGIRLTGSATPWAAYDFEISGQRGHAREIQLRGWASAAGLTLGDDSLPLRSRFRVLLDFASGDDGKDAARQSTFDPLHHARHKHLGIADIVGRRNINALTLGWEGALHPRLRVSVNHLDSWLASRRDGFYGVGGDVSVAAPEDGATSRRVDSEWDVILRFDAPVPGLSLEGGLGFFSAGRFLQGSAGDHASRKLAYIAAMFEL